MKLYMCEFFEALRIINQDFGLGLGYEYQDLSYQKKLAQFSQSAPTLDNSKKEFKYEVIP